jgi:hypothetical protein
LNLQLFDDFFCGEVASWSIMLMKSMDSDSLRGGPGGFGQSLSKRIVSFVGDSDPVDGAQDDWILGTKQNDTSASQRQFVDSADGLISHGRADWRGCIDIEPSEFDRLVGSSFRGINDGNERRQGDRDGQ